MAGKYERRPPVPLPAPLPEDVTALCGLIETGHETPQLFAALGAALLRAGGKELAYRAFDRAHRGGHADPRWIQSRKELCPSAPDAVIRYEEDEAKRWVDGLAAFKRSRKERGLDPDDLSDFYLRYGRPEENLDHVVRSLRLSWVAGAIGLLLGLGFGLPSRRLPRRAAVIPLLIGVLFLVAPGYVDRTGLFYWGAGFALGGAAVVAILGKRK